jgi:hypothetical protein
MLEIKTIFLENSIKSKETKWYVKYILQEATKKASRGRRDFGLERNQPNQ